MLHVERTNNVYLSMHSHPKADIHPTAYIVEDKARRSNPKMSSSKKIDLIRNYAAGVYLSEARNPIPPPFLTHCIRVYRTLYLSHREGGSGS